MVVDVDDEPCRLHQGRLDDAMDAYHAVLTRRADPEIERELAHLYVAARRWDAAAIHQAVIASQRRRRLVDRALMTARVTAWDFQPFSDASERYMRNTVELDDLERRARFPTPETPLPDATDRRQAPAKGGAAVIF